MGSTFWRVTRGGVTGSPAGTVVELTDDATSWMIGKPGVGVIQTLPKATTVEQHRGDDLVLSNADEGVEITLSPHDVPVASPVSTSAPSESGGASINAAGCSVWAVCWLLAAFVLAGSFMPVNDSMNNPEQAAVWIRAAAVGLLVAGPVMGLLIARATR